MSPAPGPGPVSGLRRRDIVRTSDCRQTANDSAVLRAALDHGPVARSTIARLAGLSPAVVTRLAADLIAAGLLREAEPVPSRRAQGAGRPHVPVEIDTARRAVAGLHVAVRHATLALLDLKGQVIASERIEHADTEPRGLLRRLGRRIPEFAARHAGGRTLAGLGVASGGWVDSAGGVIVEHPLLGWAGVPVRDLLEEAAGLRVRVDNHARSLARAEQLFGDSRARGSVVHLFAGNMVDAAFATGERVHHGPQSAAGSVAHLPLGRGDQQCQCGRRGCLQAAVSSREIVRRAAGDGIVDGPDIAAVLAAAAGGDRRAVALFAERARLLGTAAALLLDILNPDVLVITEQGTKHLPECLEIVRSEVAARSLRGAADGGKSVIASGFGDDALAVAAGTAMLDAVYADPLTRRPAQA